MLGCGIAMSVVEWNEFIGNKIVVDYKVSNGKIAYARGVLEGVENGMLVVRGPTRFWLVALDNVLACRVTNGEKEEGEGGYLGDAS